MKRILPLLAALLIPTAAAHAFSGEDPVFGHPFHHEAITRQAAKAAGFTSNPLKDAPDLPLAHIGLEIIRMAQDDPRRSRDGAAEALAWHADYLDSYLYSPLWWASAGKNRPVTEAPGAILARYKASRAVEQELKNLHFDDLFSTDQVNAMWRRYASGTFAGLLWASEQSGGDVAAAHNVLGVSLHAVQDFYAHSNWIDKAARRGKTLFETPRAARSGEAFYTGAYENDHQLGAKSHGKWVGKDTIFAAPGVKELMEIACDPLSPASNSDECAAYKAVKAGTSARPTIGNIRLPHGVMIYSPAGIALDNTWVADEAVKQRGLNDISGAGAFQAAHDLAVRASTQWLLRLESAMKTAGKGAFWEKIKTTPASDGERTSQFENYGKFPFLFAASGQYPPARASNGEEWWLRVQLKTAQGRTGGTNSDISVRVGQKSFPLDYLKTAHPAMAYDDFEAGDHDAYVVGPFAALPASIDLHNDAADPRDLVRAAGRDFVQALENTFKTIGGALGDIAGSKADRVAVNKALWMPEDLDALPLGGAAQPFTVELQGGKEGHYKLHGTLTKIAQDERQSSIEVRLERLECVKESTWDRGSSEDEPFLLTALNPLPGRAQQWLSPAYARVDSGETVGVTQTFRRVSIPRGAGMLNLAVTLMESDDETPETRRELLEKFAGTYEDKTKNSQDSFAKALSNSIGARWKLAEIEVMAWSRNGRIHQGRVYQSAPDRWIDPGHVVPFALNAAGAPYSGVTTDDLLPEILGDAPPTIPTTPTEPQIPITPPAPSFDLTTWVDEWDTTYGRVKLELADGVLHGRLYIASQVAGMEKESDRLELRAGNAAGELVGKSMYTGVEQPIFMSLSADGNSFNGTSGREGNIGQWSGKRRRQSPTTPTTPSVPTTPTVPVVTPPTVPTTPTVPITPTVPTTPPTSTSGFRPLGDWAIQIESTRVARDNQIEVVASFKNTQRNRATLGAGDITLIVTDSDGVGIKNIGNLYRASGDLDMQPEKIAGGIGLESAAQGRVLFLFDIPAGTTPLKTLTVVANRAKPLTFNIAGLTLPESAPAVLFPIPGAVGAQTDFADFAEFGVRFDGARRGPNGALQIFLTTQNRDTMQFRSHPGFSLNVAVIDGDGLTLKDEGNLYRATSSGVSLQKVSHNVTLVSGVQATLVYPVPMSKNTVPKQLILQYRDKKLTIDLPAVP